MRRCTGRTKAYSGTNKTFYSIDELCLIINKVYNLNIVIKEFTSEKIINKSLFTNYDVNDLFNIPELNEQIIELNNFTKYLNNY